MFSETTLGNKKQYKQTSQEPIRADTIEDTGHNLRRRVEKGPVKRTDEKQDYRQDNQANGTSSEPKAIASSQKSETNLPPSTAITRRKRPTKQFEVQAKEQPIQYSLPTSAEACTAAENDLKEPERKREKTQLRDGSHQSSISCHSDQEEHPKNGIIRLHICAEEAHQGEPQMSTGPHPAIEAADEPQTDGKFQGEIYYYVKQIKEVGLDAVTGEFLYRTKWKNWTSHTWEPEESFCTAGSRKLLEEYQQANEDEIIAQSQKAAIHRYLGRKKLNQAFARVEKITDHKLRRKTSFKKHKYIPLFYVHWTNKIEGWATYWELWASQNGLSEYRVYKKKLREEEAVRKASTDRPQKRRGRPPNGDRLSKDTQSTSGAPRKRRIRALKSWQTDRPVISLRAELKRDKSRREESWFDPTPVPCYKRTRKDRSQSVAPSSFSPCVGEESTTRTTSVNVRSPSEPRGTSASIRTRLTICEQKRRDRGSSKDRQMLVVSAVRRSSESPVSRSPSGILAVSQHVSMTADQLPTTIGKVPASLDTSRETSASDLPSSSVSTSTEPVHQSPQRRRGEDNVKATRQRREVRAGCHTSHMHTAFVSYSPNTQTSSSSSSSADTAICTGSDEFHDTCYIHAPPSTSRASLPASVESNGTTNVTEKNRKVTSSTSISSLGVNELRASSDEFHHAHHMQAFPSTSKASSSASIDANSCNVTENTENNMDENDTRLFFDAFPETHSGSEEPYQKFSERFFDTVGRRHHFGHKLITVEILLHGRHNLENPVFQFDPLDRLMTSFEPVEGSTPLHTAVLAKHNSLVKLLVELGCPLDTYPNHNGKTPLALAYEQRNKEIATSLMGAGASYLQFYDRSSRSHYEATKDCFDDCVIYNHDCLRLNLRKLQPKAFMDERFEEVSTVTGSLNDGLRHRFNFDVPTMKLGFQYIAVVVGFGEKCRTRLAKVLVNGERVKKGTYGFICPKLEENNILELHFLDEKKRGKSFAVQIWRKSG